MAACPRCGSFLVLGAACEFCARYGGGAPQQPPQPWQPPEWQPAQYQAPRYTPARAYGGGYAVVDTGIRPFELAWARTRLMWVWILVGAIGVLTIALRWVIANDPQAIFVMGMSLLMDPAKVSSSDQTSLAVWQVVAYFVLSWLPLAGLALHSFLSHPQNGLEYLNSAFDLSPMLYQGFVYVLLAVLIWRRSMVALTVATLLFLADSGIYTYAVLRLFQALWELSQHFVEMTQQYPSLAANNPYDLVHWPWGLVVPIVVRGAVLWFLLTSFSGMSTVRLHHRRLKAAQAEEQAQAA